jgi:hypothetical protein
MSAWTLAQIIEHGSAALQARYGERLRSQHRQALRALRDCRSGALGTLQLHCDACGEDQCRARSCGHRSCPQCQFHTTDQWLQRQLAKRLPVDYFLVTFTLPAELRGVARARPTAVYDALFRAASGTLKAFGSNHKLQVQLGLCAVLHTHSRTLDYHPHLHVVVPGGGIDVKRRQWKRFQGRYLFNAQTLARVFRARLLAALADTGLAIPRGIRNRWVVDCRNVGNGQHALDYLSRYLYRGVIHNSQIDAVDPDAGTVTFHYTEAKTQSRMQRRLPIADFLWTVLQHVLPPGYHRVREYGFVNANARTTLRLVQWLLKARVPAPVHKPGAECTHCHAPLRVTLIIAPRRLIT